MINSLADIQSTNIGEGTRVWQFCVVLPGAVIGKNCNINCHVFIENDVVIGDNVTIKSGVQLWDGLRVGDKVFIGPNATFTNDVSPRSQIHPLVFLRTILEEGVSIGANSTILAGIVISSYAMIGAGSVVTKNIPPYTLWYGNPAIHKGYVTKEGTVISLSLFDKERKKYKLVNEEPIVV